MLGCGSIAVHIFGGIHSARKRVALYASPPRGGNPQLAYTTAGSLKPLHAVAMHAILVLPGVAWLLQQSDWPESHRLRVVWLAIAADAVLTAIIGVEAFTGVSPFAAPLPVLAGSGIAAAVLAGCALYALISPSWSPKRTY